MGHHAFEPGVRGARDGGDNFAGRGSGTQPPHAGIDLEMVGHSPARQPAGAIQIPNLSQRVDRRGETVLDQSRDFVVQESAHHQNAWRGNAVLAQVNAFLHRTDRQPARSLGLQGAGNLQRAVPISVRLDHSGNRHVRAHHGTDVAVVSGNSFAGNEGVGSIWEGHSIHSRLHPPGDRARTLAPRLRTIP